MLSRGLASAAADGLRTPPARETATSVDVAVAVAVGAGVTAALLPDVAADADADAAGAEGAAGGDAGAAAPLAPMVKSSCPEAVAGLHAVWSSFPPATVMHVALLPFWGTRGSGPAPPLNVNN